MITEYKLEDAGREMLITVKRSSRKTLGLEVREMGKYLPGFQRSYQTEAEIFPEKWKGTGLLRRVSW